MINYFYKIFFFALITLKNINNINSLKLKNTFILNSLQISPNIIDNTIYNLQNSPSLIQDKIPNVDIREMPTKFDFDSIYNFVDEGKIDLSMETTKFFDNIPIDKHQLVRDIANFLPNIDLIGHQVLLANKDLIPIIYEMDDIPHDLKKDLILGIIKLSQYGDSFGGILLNNYHNIVDLIL